MEQIVNDIITFLLPQNDLFVYVFLFISAIIENLFPPIPGDTITIFGAFLVGTGRLSYLLVYAATTLGSVTGFMLLVSVGRVLEREFFMNKNYRFFSAESIVAAERWFERYGYFVVLANRFLPGVRSVISLVSGITRLNLPKVLLLALASASLWNLIWIQIGFVLGNNWQVVRQKAGILIGRYNIVMAVIIALALAGFIIYNLAKKRGNQKKNNAG
ncbi:MAG TPA: DedA family protein [Spirochaetota bacterium]|nr:DedA family protein [Spirochaetota bacterium]HPL18558.1 DedA family protein [Spirochaetota bacterium]HQJ71897.1 DedA family protein [Spirochaetota bacterium]HRS77065.1 DedA family protein [Spirochaetota bacterium]HRT74851.1 DedA family protein [Spirochaetota bacterium]